MGADSCPASREGNTLYTASPGKNKNSKFELWFLLNLNCFCTIGKVEKIIKLEDCVFKEEMVMVSEYFFTFQ